MKEITTPSDRAKFTIAINKFLEGKRKQAEGKAECDEAMPIILDYLNGDQKANWTAEKEAFAISATYGKTRSTLAADLIEKVLGVKVTEACYKVSAPWNEIRIKVI